MPSRILPPPAAAAAADVGWAHHRRLQTPLNLRLIAGAVIAAVVAAVLAVLLYRRFARGRASPTAPSPPSHPAGPLRRFSYAHLRRATASFTPSHRLGHGGFGPVFRGVLSSGEEVAVKLMDSYGSLQGEREFHNELALAAKILSVPTSDEAVVPAIGYCSDDGYHSSRLWKWWRRRERGDRLEESEAVAAAEAVPGRKLLLVYELMHNGSLQDALLDRRCVELSDWSRRFAVVLDVARGLNFLHSVCDPPVIHGDIKPSNILLDARLSAKIADFGLAHISSSLPEDHIPTEEEVKVNIDLDKCQGSDFKVLGKERKNDWDVGCGEDVDSIFAGGEMAESVTTATTGLEEQANGEASGIAATDRSLEEDEGFTLTSPTTAVDAASASDMMSVDSGKDLTPSTCRKGCSKKKIGAPPAKDWWWRQDMNGAGPNSEPGGSVKDYVMEWIRSEIKKERPRSDWATAPTATSTEECLPKLPNTGRTERKKADRRREWWASLDEGRLKKKEKNRPAREWWREEFCEELTNKQKRRAIAKSKSSHDGNGEPQWWQNDKDLTSPSEKRKRKKKRSYSRGSRSSIDWWMDRIGGETRTAGRSSRDWASGDIPKSGTVSSTPSMRGTVCYVAPEYGGGGPLSEKCDIYSFGVLMLVIVSGRRPLQVTASPMSEFERANLISWTRHLAHLGRLLDLLDPCLRCVDREQALLCITVALLCLQRSPARRPSSKEILGMLTGESEPPHLPLEFSPSPPGGFSFKLRKKARSVSRE